MKNVSFRFLVLLVVVICAFTSCKTNKYGCYEFSCPKQNVSVVAPEC